MGTDHSAGSFTLLDIRYDKLKRDTKKNLET